MTTCASMGINVVSTSNSVSSHVQGGKTFNSKLFDRICDHIAFTTALENTPVMGNSFLNCSQFSRNLSDEELQKINETRKLPEDYVMTFTPKTIIHNFKNSRYVGDTVTPPTYNLMKADSQFVKFYEKNRISNVIPKGFKVMNNSKGKTFVVSEKETLESLDKKTRTLLERITSIFKK